MQKTLKERLDNIPSEFKPLKDFVERYSDKQFHIDSLDTIQLVKNPHFDMGYFIKLFAPAKQSFFDIYKSRYDSSIPSMLIEFLMFSNGFHFCDFSIFGLTPSMYNSTTGLLDHSIVQPFDIGTANEFWKLEYDRNDFHFGGRDYNDETNCGYFFDNGLITCCLTDGKVINTWSSFMEFLNDELTTVEEKETSLNNG